MGGLVAWKQSNQQEVVTMELGDGWGNMSVATEEQVELFKEWFETQKAF
jgi:hypothetical protein